MTIQNEFEQYKKRVLAEIIRRRPASIAKETGLSIQTLSNYATGYRELSYTQAIRIGNFLGVK